MLKFRQMLNILFLPLIIFSFLFIGINNSYSQEKDAIQVVQKNYSYQIIQKGQELPNGSYTPAKVYKMEQLSPDNYMPNAFYVKTKQKMTINKDAKTLSSFSLQSVLNGINAKAVRAPYAGGNTKENTSQTADKIGVDRIYEITYNSDKDPYEICKELMSNPEVEYAVPIFKRYFCFTPNDLRISNQWDIMKMQMQLAWDISQGDTNVVIAIVDSGTDWTHEDLAANIWTNPGESGLDAKGHDKRTNGIDDDGNGKIDDWHGWDLVGDRDWTQLYNNDFIEDNNPTNLMLTHGTHVAGCASAVTNNAKGIAGIGFKCKLLPVKCASDKYSWSGIYKGYEGIKYAADLHADIINCSWGGAGSSPAEQDIINYAVDKGSLVIVAAGNNYAQNIDDGGFYPAGYDNVLAVGATDNIDQVADFSNIGSRITVYTPGVNIDATLPNNQYAEESGTSMASPNTSGVAGLVKSLHPDWTPKQITKQIRITSDNVLTSDHSKRNTTYYGRINAYNALNYNHPGGPQIPGIEISSVTLATGDAITSYDPLMVHLTIQNYLYKATQLNLNIKPTNNLISMTKQDYSIGDLASDSSINIDITIQLNNSNLWYNGRADLIAYFTAGGNYQDYQMFSIPIKIPSNNLYSQVSKYQDWQTVKWNSVHSPTKDILWAVGTGNLFGGSGGFHKFVSGQSSDVAFTNDVPNAVFAFDAQYAFIGSAPKNLLTKIWSTTNGGTNWSSVGVENITPKVEVIHFFDNNWGMFIGDPKGTRFGIGVTNNGGKGWSPIPSGPVILSGEVPFTTSAWFIGSNVWFGTSKGRVIKSSDKGNSWQVGTISKAQNVYCVSIADSGKGLAVYNETTGGDVYVANTIDGGAHWTSNVQDLTKLGYNPIYTFKTDSSNNIYALCSLGEVIYTTDWGKTWLTVLSEKDAPMGAGYYSEYGIDRGRIWELGSTIGHLDFDYSPNNAVKELQITTGTTLDFGTVNVGEYLIKPINIQNIGNVSVNLLKLNIVPAPGTESTEFTLFGIPPTSIAAADTKTIRVRFYPKDSSLRQASFNVYNDGIQPVYSVQLSGYGYEEPNGVNDNSVANNLFLEQNYPNPCASETYVSFTSNENNFAELSVINSLGETLNVLFSGTTQQGKTVLRFNTDALMPGVYFFKLKTGSTVAYKKFIVAR